LAIYHLTAKAYPSRDGHSATAGAAYRAGVRIEDLRTGEVHDYTKRHGVAFSALCLPGDQTADRAEFWNRVEGHHKRGDAITCREVEVALPAELHADARRELAHAFAKHLADTYGIAADLAIHEPSKRGDERNHHAHILLSACHAAADGTLGKKAEALDPIACKRAKRPTLADTEREHWAGMVNTALERAQLDARVDHRSLADQKAEAAHKGDFRRYAEVDRIATKHEGNELTQARRRGHRPRRVRRNDRIQQVNTARHDAHQSRFQRLMDAAKAEGRLASVDEQAAHARALLERRKEAAVRFQQTAESLTAGAAGQARARVPRTPRAGASVPRPAARAAGQQASKPKAQIPAIGHTRVIGNGTRESDQAARLANLWLAQLENDIADLIRRALAWAQNHSEPLPRSLARDYLQAEGEAQLATVMRTQATADLKQARRARLDARYYRDQGEIGLKGKDKLAQRLGWTPRTLRDLQDAVKQSEDAVVHAKQAEQQAITAQEATTAEAERHRSRLMDGFLKAHPEENFQFPEQWPPGPVPGLAPISRKEMGAGSALQPPRLGPPRPNASKPFGMR